MAASQPMSTCDGLQGIQPSMLFRSTVYGQNMYDRNNHDFIPYIMIEKITHFFVVFFIGHVLSKLSESLLGFLFGADFLR